MDIEGAQVNDDHDVRLTPRRPTILVVDDDPDVLEVVELLLARKRYRVRRASNGDEALAIAAAPGPIDLALIDVVMPGLDGFAVSERMRAIRPDLEMLYMSGYSEQLNQYASTLPADAILAKPFGPNELWRKVARLVG